MNTQRMLPWRGQARPLGKHSTSWLTHLPGAGPTCGQGLRLVFLEPGTTKSCWVSIDPMTTSQVGERF